MGDKTATERLRALLDERGVEYELTAWSCGAAVWWRDSSGTMWRAHDNDEDELLSFYAYNSVTPEQAIAATLGSCNCSNGERTSDSDATGERQRVAVEVVRCRDCEYARIMRPLDWRTGKPSTVIEEWYCQWHSNPEGASDIDPDGFCAWGERKDA